MMTLSYFNKSRGELGWCLDMISTHGAWRHAEVQFLLPGAWQSKSYLGEMGCILQTHPCWACYHCVAPANLSVVVSTAWCIHNQCFLANLSERSFTHRPHRPTHTHTRTRDILRKTFKTSTRNRREFVKQSDTHPKEAHKKSQTHPTHELLQKSTRNHEHHKKTTGKPK